MNHVTELVRTPAIQLERFEHDAEIAHHDPDSERASTHALNFVESGSFDVRATGAARWRRVTTANIFVTTPGFEFACRHHHEYPDDACVSVRLADASVESLLQSGARVPRAPVVALTNRRAYLRRQIGELTPRDPARAEALAGELFWSLSADSSKLPLFRAQQLSWYVARVDRAKAMMDAHFAEPLSLTDMARDAGMSLYHFARVFNELDGQPPHRRLVDVRLQHARRRLLDGDRVTETCYAVGFGSLSHFITSYKKKFGQPPSATTA